MIETNVEVSKDLEKALQALQQAKQRVANEKKKQNEKKRKAEKPHTYIRYSSRKFSQKMQFSKGIIQCIIKVMKEGDIFEYDRADTPAGFRTSEIAPLYGR